MGLLANRRAVFAQDYKCNYFIRMRNAFTKSRALVVARCWVRFCGCRKDAMAVALMFGLRHMAG